MGNRQIDLSQLSQEPVERRLYLAKESKDPDILRTLRNDSFWFVRDYVASNLCTSEDVLQELRNDPDFRVCKDAERTLQTLALSRARAADEIAEQNLPLNERIRAAAARVLQGYSTLKPAHEERDLNTGEMYYE